MGRGSLAHSDSSCSLWYKFSLELQIGGLTNLRGVTACRCGAHRDGSEANSSVSPAAPRGFLWYQMGALVLRAAQDRTSPQGERAEWHMMLFSLKMLLGEQEGLQE